MKNHEMLMVDGYKQTFHFANGFGASVICNKHSYGGHKGLFEVAVLNRDGEISYDTPITTDVVGWLTFGEVAALLKRIENL